MATKNFKILWGVYISSRPLCANHYATFFLLFVVDYSTCLSTHVFLMSLHWTSVHMLMRWPLVPHSSVSVCVCVCVCYCTHARICTHAHVLFKDISFWAPSSPFLASHQFTKGGTRQGAPMQTQNHSPPLYLLLAVPSDGPWTLQFQVLAPGKVIEAEIGCPFSLRENKNILIKARKALGTIALAPGWWM